MVFRKQREQHQEGVRETQIPRSIRPPQEWTPSISTPYHKFLSQRCIQIVSCQTFKVWDSFLVSERKQTCWTCWSLPCTSHQDKVYESPHPRLPSLFFSSISGNPVMLGAEDDCIHRARLLWPIEGSRVMALAKWGGVSYMYMYMHVRVGWGSEIALWPLFPKQTPSPLCWLSDLTCPALWGFYCTLQTTSGVDIGGFWRSVYNVPSQIPPLKPKKSHDNGPGTEAGLILISIWHSVVPVWSHKKLIHVATPMVVAQPLRQERKRERQRHIMWGWQTDGIPKGGDRTSCLFPRGTTCKPVSTLEGWESAGRGQEWWVQSLR